MKIMFMGTPDFALFSLKALAEGKDKVVAVVTQPDKPQGRGYTLVPPPVKRYATEKGIEVFQPNTLKDGAFAEELSRIDPDMIVVAAYGKILPSYVIDYPKYGCINVHGSYLPKYRGAAPMQRAIIDGMKTTGVTIMRMDVGLDTGAMLARKKISIKEDDNFETIHDKIGIAGAQLLVETIEKIKKGEVKSTKQYGKLATYADKISKDDRKIDFSKSADEVHNLIRGLSPVPLAVTGLPDGRLLKVISAEKSDKEKGKAACGTVISTVGGVITVACGEGCINITSVVPEGQKKMSAADFIRGRGVAEGDILCLK